MESICDADQNCLRNHGLKMYGSQVTGGQRGKWVVLAHPGPKKLIAPKCNYIVLLRIKKYSLQQMMENCCLPKHQDDKDVMNQ